MQTAKEEFDRHFSSITKHMREDDVQALLQALTPIHVSAGEGMIHDGETSDAIYFVQQGSLEASITADGKKISLGQVLPGQWLGEVSMLDPGPATATVTAVSDCELLRLGRADFESLDQHRPMLMNVLIRSLLKLLIARLRSSTDQLIRLADDSHHSFTPIHAQERSADAYAALNGTRR